MTGIISQYMMRAIIAATALVLIVLLALAGLFEFIAELDDTQGNYQTPRVILYTLLRLPQLAFEMLPVAVLIGSLLALGGLAANSEIIVMRSSGLSIRRLSGMVAITGFALLVFTGLLGEFIGPPLDYYARNMRLQARYEQEDDRLGNETWVRDGPVMLHLERVSAEFEFGAVYMFLLDENDGLAAIAKADNSGIDDDDRWILENLRETRFQDDGVRVVESSIAVESFNIDAEVLGISTGGAGARLLIGVVIGLAYYLASEMLANSGQVFNLDPALVAWLPSLALAAVTLFALNRVR
jgi:lipopolysaccharide export system permease protein